MAQVAALSCSELWESCWTFMECLRLCARPHARPLMCSYPFNPHNNIRRWKWFLCLQDMGENWGTERKQRVQGHISGKWQKQTSSPALANFGANTCHNYTILALLASQGTTAEARKSLLIQLTSILNLSPFLCPQPPDFQYLLRPPPTTHTHTHTHTQSPTGNGKTLEQESSHFMADKHPLVSVLRQTLMTKESTSYLPGNQRPILYSSQRKLKICTPFHVCSRSSICRMC